MKQKKQTPNPLAGLGEFLNARTYKEQLEFWTAFRRRHRERVGKAEAPLVPSMLKAVDERIALLKPLAAAEASHG